MLTPEELFGDDLLDIVESAGPRVRVWPGRRYAHVLPHSEVCMHFGKAGTVMQFELIERIWQRESWYQYSVQLFRDDGTHYSGTITTGEAGLFHDEERTSMPVQAFYFYPWFPPPANEAEGRKLERFLRSYHDARTTTSAQESR
jgi:hypothetical protein